MGYNWPLNGPFYVHDSKLQNRLTCKTIQKSYLFLYKITKNTKKSSFWSHFSKKSEIVSKTTKNLYPTTIYPHFQLKNIKIRSHFFKKSEINSKEHFEHQKPKKKESILTIWRNIRKQSSIILQLHKTSPQPR